MRWTRFALLAAPLVLGCNQGLQGFDDTGTGLPGNGHPDTDPETIFDQFEEREDCYGYDEQPIPGATSYFFGDFRVNDDRVSGHEYWVLLANDRWQELGEDDCFIVWNLQGSVEESGCFSCDYSLHLHAEINLEGTTCPDGLHAGEESFDVSYDVRLTSDGRSEFTYVESGNELGQGVWHGDSVTYVTRPRCMFF